MYITFENPAYLWYFFSIPLLVVTHFISLKSAKRKAMKFANFRALKRISGTKLVTKNTTVLLIRVITVSLLILSASGLKFWYLSEKTDNNYVIAIDVSSSMNAEDIKPTRLDAAKNYAKTFIGTLDGDSKVGVLTFSGVTLISQTLTKDKNIATASIDEISVVQAGGTDIPGAIITGTNMLLADPNRGKVLVLLTDGSTTLGNYIDSSLEKSLAYVQQNNIIVHAIGIGSETGPIGYLPSYYNISATYNERTLRTVTNSTGGVLLQTYENDQVAESFNSLLGVKDEAYVQVDLDYGLLLVGILILFIEWGLMNSRYRRIA